MPSHSSFYVKLSPSSAEIIQNFSLFRDELFIQNSRGIKIFIPIGSGRVVAEEEAEEGRGEAVEGAGRVAEEDRGRDRMVEGRAWNDL